MPTPASGQTYFQSNQALDATDQADWFNSTNWTGGSVPNSGTIALVANGYPVTIDAPGATAHTLILDDANGPGAGMTVTGAGTLDVTTTLQLGYDYGTSTTLNVTDGGQVMAGGYDVVVANEGYNSSQMSTGSILVTGAGSEMILSGSLHPSVWQYTSSTITVADSGLFASSSVALSITSNGIPGTYVTFNIDGTPSSQGILRTGYFTGGNTGGTTVNFNGGILQASSNQTNYFQNYGSSQIDILSGGGTIDTQSYSIGISPNIQGTGMLTKVGTGTLTLSGNNTYSGATNVNVGTLEVDGSIASSATTVNSGAQLQGSGTVGSVTMNAGSTLMAGNATTLGTLTTGSLLFNANATLEFKLDSSVSSSDSFTVTGTLALNHTSLVFQDLTSGEFAPGTQLTLISYGAGMANGLGTGSDLFDYNGVDLTNGSIFTVGADTFQINYAAGDPAITLTSVNGIPEPSTWASLLLGLALLVVVRSCRGRA